MEHRLQTPSPGGYERAHAESYRLAFDRLAQSDLAEVCRRSGGVRLGEDAIGLNFLAQEISVDVSRRMVNSTSSAVAMADQLVILHYLVTAGGKTPSGKMVSFKELPEGGTYYPTFYRRAVAPILKRFSESVQYFPAAATSLGGRPIAHGDAGAEMQVLPRVTLSWVLWQGDAEFPAEGTVLFDGNIIDYLPTEDIAVLCQSIALKLCGT